MAKKVSRSGKRRARTALPAVMNAQVSSDTEALLLAALERGGDTSTTGRFLVTFKEGAAEAGVQYLQSTAGFRIADARDFTDQAVTLAQAGDADALVFPDIHVALVGGAAAAERGFTVETAISSDDPLSSIDPEYFVFGTSVSAIDYAKGALDTAQLFARVLGLETERLPIPEVDAEALGATWGLNACRVPQSTRDGNGIRVAVLDTGFDLGHPEFAGRSITSKSFVGQPVQDLHGHGTHTTGTACGPNSPAGAIQRYGVACKSQMFVGKILTNTGTGTQGETLAGINWAVVNRCAVISMSIGAKIPVQPAYTAAGQAALNNGCLIIAAAGNSSPGPTEAPGNSPTVLAVGAVDINLRPAPFSCQGKVDLAGPGVNIFSSWIRPLLHNTISGTSMATPHVAGCAALWAQSNAGLRGASLRARLLATARKLPFAASLVGNGLVQAP
jgi:subtilisin